MIDEFAKPMNIKQKKCYKLLDKSLENLFYNQEEFDISDFNLRILEILMNLERKQYQEELYQIPFIIHYMAKDFLEKNYKKRLQYIHIA